ncbi:MAG: hypothetical protein ABW202_03855 [Duganella sp.]
MSWRARLPPPLTALLLAMAIAASAAAASAAAAPATCIPLRVGYTDQHLPPYWLGEGKDVPNPPGAGVDFIKEAAKAAGFGCAPTWVRLPAVRLPVALASGDIDMAPLGEMNAYPPAIALPHDKSGNIDLDRAVHNMVVVLVRASDKLPAGIEPMAYFKGKVLGASQGFAYTRKLRAEGLSINDGGRDLERNLEKLKLGRLDGVVVAAVAPEHLRDALARHKGAIVLLPQPLLKSRVWLAFNSGYYREHRGQAEALWNWLLANRPRVGSMLGNSRKQD